MPNRKKILIVDDTPENLQVLGELLEQDGFEVQVATSGTQALRTAATSPTPNLILLDILMPGMDGYEVCRRLKAKTATRDIPVIFLSALSDAVDEAKGLALGAVDYITKPFKLELVKMRVDNQIALQQARAELQAYTVQLEEMVLERTLQVQLNVELLQAIFNAPLDVIFILNAGGQIVEMNEAASHYLGYGREELLNHNFATIFPVEHAAFVPEHLKLVLTKGKMSSECQHRHRDGHFLPVENIATRFEIKGEERICVIVRDLTERKAAEAAVLQQRETMLQADKMISLGTLVSGVAHEINNPLAALRINVPILNRFWADALPVLRAAEVEQGPHTFDGLPFPIMEKELASFQKDIQDCTKRIEVIVQSLRTYARQGTAPEQERLDLNAVVQNILPLLTHQIEKSTCRFQKDLDPEPLFMLGNFVRLEQVVMNLVLNACQALPNSHCRVILRTRLRAKANEVLLEVEDEGQGMAPENAARIFDPFFTTKHDSGGTGLGLSIVQGIVQEHRGRIEVKSALRQGTTMSVFLPLFPREQA